MAYFKITIIQTSGKKLKGIRHFEDKLTDAQVERQTWDRANETLGRRAIEGIVWEKLPADHPEVVAYNLKRMKG